ncbi:VOC family protein [Sphingobium sp. B2]|uniref:VOC family protein n=1 Tax=Sphingobium sp. B2 TaxID=2583228 RepID=UPI001643F1F0|nr:VOC family protein [Sphingobium sp. B2]
MGFSHVGVSTHDMEATIAFYEGLLGYPRVVDEKTGIREGGVLRQVYFDLGEGQFIVFMEAKGVAGIPESYDTGINGALGTPGGMYHFAFRVDTLAQLEAIRCRLAEAGTDVSGVIDLEAAKSVFLSDPNGLQIELCWHFREFDEADLRRTSQASLATGG